ncbi:MULTISPECIES: hypothetical protein [unclassified Paenibacillus]|uniref:hypothetical protein n=1 Tax=unclassified Paenibacillus TaxID=185978 RepID=UPI003635F9F8
MFTMEDVYISNINTLNQSSDLFREEIELYLSENNLIIENYSITNKIGTIELCIDTKESHNYYFTFNKNNGDYGVIKATQVVFDSLSDDEKV